MSGDAPDGDLGMAFDGANVCVANVSIGTLSKV